jgi:hypothetical protein
MSTPPSYLMMLRGGGAMKVVVFFNPGQRGRVGVAAHLHLFEWATTENQLFYVHAFNPPWAMGVLLISKVGP